MAYNDANGIIPTTIVKPIRPPMHNAESEESELLVTKGKMSKKELELQIASIEKEMRKAAKEYDFERAAELRDIMFELKEELQG